MTREQVQSRIALAKMQRENRKDGVQEILDMLTNDFGTTSQSDGSYVNLLAPNFMMSTKRQMVAQLYPSDPKFRCIPRMRGFENRAIAVEGLLQYYWRELNVQESVKYAIEDALVYGYGVIKIGMGSFETGIGETDTEDDNTVQAMEENERMLVGESAAVSPDDNHKIHLQIHLELQQNPSLLEEGNAAEIIEVLNEHIEAHQEFIEEPIPSFPTSAGKGPNYDWPFVESVGPDIFWDPLVIDPRESAYIIHRIKKRLKDVKDDPLYINTSELSPDSYDSEELAAYKTSNNVGDDQSSYIPEELGTITMYEIWDADTKTVSTWVEASEKAIRPPDEEAWPLFIEGYPFRWLNFTDMPGESHGPGIMEYLKWPQKFLMRIYSELATHSDRSGVKFEIDENRLSQKETQDSIEAKLADPTSHVALFVQERGAINPIPPTMIDPSKMQLISLLERVIYENSGITTEMRGVAGSNTATQASIMASASNILSADSIGRIERFQRSIGQDLIGEVRQFGPEDQILRIVLPGGKEGWINFTLNDVQVEWQVEVEMPSPAQGERDLQQFLNMFHMFSPFMDTIGRRQAMMDGMRLFGVKYPEVYAIELPADVVGNINYENQSMLEGKPAQVVEGQEHDEHIKGHNEAINEWNQVLQQMIGSVLQNNPALQQNPQAMQSVQQQIMQQPEASKMGQAIQMAQQHVEQHQQMMQNAGQPQGGGGGTRRREAVPYPTGNTGRTQSIISNQAQAS